MMAAGRQPGGRENWLNWAPELKVSVIDRLQFKATNNQMRRRRRRRVSEWHLRNGKLKYTYSS